MQHPNKQSRRNNQVTNQTIRGPTQKGDPLNKFGPKKTNRDRSAWMMANKESVANSSYKKPININTDANDGKFEGCT